MATVTYGTGFYGADLYGTGEATAPGVQSGIRRTVRGLDGGVNVIPDAQLAAALAAGGVEALPPYVDLPDDLGAWDTGPRYVIAHADGRRYAVTINNYANYYAPVGFFLIGPELPSIVVPGGAARTTQAGDTRITDAGDIRITAV